DSEISCELLQVAFQVTCADNRELTASRFSYFSERPYQIPLAFLARHASGGNDNGQVRIPRAFCLFSRHRRDPGNVHGIGNDDDLTIRNAEVRDQIALDRFGNSDDSSPSIQTANELTYSGGFDPAAHRTDRRHVRVNGKDRPWRQQRIDEIRFAHETED